MEESLNIGLGPVVLKVISEDWILRKFDFYFEKYRTNRNADATLEIRVNNELSRIDYDALINIFFISTIEGTKIETCCAFIEASFDFESKTGYAYFPGEHTVSEEIDVFSQRAILMYLQLVFSVLLLERDCLLIHAAGIVHNGQGHLFAGHTFAGKSTIAMKAENEGMKILGDDCVGLDVKNRKLFSTFFKSDFNVLEADFASCSFISHDVKFSRTPISKKDATYALIKNNHLILYLKQEARPFVRKLIKLSSLAANLVHTYELKSRLEDKIWVMI